MKKNLEAFRRSLQSVMQEAFFCKDYHSYGSFHSPKSVIIIYGSVKIRQSVAWRPLNKVQ
ncbi:hypothetical protein GCM10008933_30980 [Paenibacillus motobuensis]|uniref:Uncharacterized protein n=1 Tax=Paenibacillus motobuensis TaxID=295324 RepID=A0ABP3IDX6_9BACL